jgi:hypothetical protein
MNPIIKLFQNKIFLFVVIVIMVSVIIYLLTDNFKDTFNSLGDFSRVPPHIENLPLQQMMPQVPPAHDRTPDTGTNYNTGTHKNINNGAPNFGRTNQENTIESTSMIPGNLFRTKTGREAYEEEQFVSIYDANFGGMLGTTMGLN